MHCKRNPVICIYLHTATIQIEALDTSNHVRPAFLPRIQDLHMNMKATDVMHQLDIMDFCSWLSRGRQASKSSVLIVYYRVLHFSIIVRKKKGPCQLAGFMSFHLTDDIDQCIVPLCQWKFEDLSNKMRAEGCWRSFQLQFLCNHHITTNSRSSENEFKVLSRVAFTTKIFRRLLSPCS